MCYINNQYSSFSRSLLAVAIAPSTRFLTFRFSSLESSLLSLRDLASATSSGTVSALTSILAGSVRAGGGDRPALTDSPADAGVARL